jgi:hypothetical protein
MSTPAQRDRHVAAANKAIKLAEGKVAKARNLVMAALEEVATAKARLAWYTAMPVDGETPPMIPAYDIGHVEVAEAMVRATRYMADVAEGNVTSIEDIPERKVIDVKSSTPRVTEPIDQYEIQ